MTRSILRSATWASLLTATAALLTLARTKRLAPFFVLLVTGCLLNSAQADMMTFTAVSITGYGETIIETSAAELNQVFLDGYFTAKASATASNGNLHLYVDAQAYADFYIAGEVKAQAFWADSVKLVWDLPGPEGVLPPNLSVNIKNSGSVSLQNGETAGSAGSLSITAGGTAYYKTLSAFDNSFAPFLTFQASADSADNFKMNFEAAVGLNVLTYDEEITFGKLNFKNTIGYDSILMPDGTTPESNGWRLDFDSGIQSPNLSPQAVPEPASLTLAGIGVVGLVLNAVRRRRQTKLAENHAVSPTGKGSKP